MPGKRDKKPPPRAKRVVRPAPRYTQAKAQTNAPDPVSKETAQDERGPRLDELVASRSVHSRRAVQEIIREGRVVLDGIVVTEPGLRIADERVYDAKGGLKLDCRPLDHALPKVTVALHKTDPLTVAHHNTEPLTVAHHNTESQVSFDFIGSRRGPRDH